MLRTLSNFIEWINQLEKEFLYEGYSHIKMHIMAYKFKEEKYTITHLKLQFSSNSIVTSKWRHSLNKKAIFIELSVKIEDLLGMVSLEDDQISITIGILKLYLNKNLNLPSSYENYLKMVRSLHGEYIGYRSPINMSFLYLNHLYNRDGTYLEYKPKETEVKFPVLFTNYPKQLFIKDGDLLNGKEIIDEVFGTNYLTFTIPILIIEYPIESFKFRSTGKISANEFAIKISWDIKKEYEKICDINYFVRDKKYPVTNKSISIEEKFADEFLIIDFLILWKGDPRLVAENSRIFWRFYHSLQYMSDTKNRIKDYKKNVKEIRENLRTNSIEIEERMSSYNKISSIYRKIAGEFRYLSGSTLVNLTKKIWLYQRLESKYYAKFLLLYKDHIPTKNQNIQTYLWLATILFRDFKEVKDFVFRAEKRRLSVVTHYSYIGASPHFQINEIYYRINDAVKVTQERLEEGFHQLEYYTLLDNFEILGDLHVHMGLLELISDDSDFYFRKSHNDLSLATQCYEKALKYEIKTEIPGVARLSVYVQNYMPIFHKFMDNNFLEKKITYINDFLNAKKKIGFREPEKDPYGIQKTLETLIDEIYEKSSKIGIKKSKINSFLEQFKKDNLERIMAILLSNTEFRTTQEVTDELIKLIDMKVGDYKNTILVYTPGMDLKSNTFFVSDVSKTIGHKFRVLPLNDNLFCELEKLDKKQKYDLVFLDDIIGTGRQFYTIFENIFHEKSGELEKKFKPLENIKFYLLASFGSLDSREFISQKLPFFKFDNIQYANLIRKDKQAFSTDPDISDVDMERLKRFLKEADEEYWNGYNDSQFLVILKQGCPNSSIGCFWRENTTILPLWKRIHY